MSHFVTLRWKSISEIIRWSGIVGHQPNGHQKRYIHLLAIRERIFNGARKLTISHQSSIHVIIMAFLSGVVGALPTQASWRAGGFLLEELFKSNDLELTWGQLLVALVVDSSLVTTMTCMSHYEIKPLIYEKFVQRKYGLHTNDKL